MFSCLTDRLRMLTAIAQAEEALSAIVLENSSDDEPAADDVPADNVI